jgi:hypothetical protein
MRLGLEAMGVGTEAASQSRGKGRSASSGQLNALTSTAGHHPNTQISVLATTTIAATLTTNQAFGAIQRTGMSDGTSVMCPRSVVMPKIIARDTEQQTIRI